MRKHPADLSTSRKANRALYASCQDAKGNRVTFRIGQPGTDAEITARHLRLDGRLSSFAYDGQGRLRSGAIQPRRITVRHDGRRFPVQHFEIRHVDDLGRGIGSERHSLAFPVPYRNVRSSL